MSYIDRFGVEAVTGRKTLSAGEIRRMIMTENIVNAVRSRKAADNWATWAKDNPALAELLDEVENLDAEN